MKNEGKYAKVMFRIHIDKDKEGKEPSTDISNCVLLNKLLSLDPDQD
jgi:hypothetical protein